MPWEDQVSTVFDWLRDSDRPANLVYWYLPEPDWHGHKYGPDSPEVSTYPVTAPDSVSVIAGALPGKSVYM